jgi:hypothetical protein
VMPAVIYCRAMINMPKYKAVLNAPKMVSCFHSFLCGNLFFLINKEKPSKRLPAKINRIVKNNRGSTESKPNLPATEAEDHKIEKRIPVSINLDSATFTKRLD